MTPNERLIDEIRSAGVPYRGDDETLLRPPERPGYVLVTLRETGALVTLAALRAEPCETGLGTWAMQRLTEAADRHGATLILTPAPLDYYPPYMRADIIRRLIAFYRRFGFTGSSMFMTRKPVVRVRPEKV